MSQRGYSLTPYEQPCFWHMTRSSFQMRQEWGEGKDRCLDGQSIQTSVLRTDWVWNHDGSIICNFRLLRLLRCFSVPEHHSMKPLVIQFVNARQKLKTNSNIGGVICKYFTGTSRPHHLTKSPPPFLSTLISEITHSLSISPNHTLSCVPEVLD